MPNDERREKRAEAAKLMEQCCDLHEMVSKRGIKPSQQINIAGNHLSATLCAAMSVAFDRGVAEGHDKNALLKLISDFIYDEYIKGYKITILRLMAHMRSKGYSPAAIDPEGFLRDGMAHMESAPVCGHAGCRSRWVETGEARCLIGDERGC